MAFHLYTLLPHLHNANVCKIDVESFSLAKPLTLLVRIRKSFLNTNFTIILRFTAIKFVVMQIYQKVHFVQLYQDKLSCTLILTQRHILIHRGVEKNILTKILWSNCTVVGFSVKFRNAGENARISSGIHLSAILGNEL